MTLVGRVTRRASSSSTPARVAGSLQARRLPDPTTQRELLSSLLCHVTALRRCVNERGGGGLLARGCHHAGQLASASRRCLMTTIPNPIQPSTCDLDRGREQLDPRTVLVVDEAGMLGSRKLAGLLDQP